MSATIWIIAIPIVFFTLMFSLSALSDNDYSPAGSFFDTYPVSCPICGNTTRFSKKLLQRSAAKSLAQARTLRIYCKECQADLKACWLIQPYVRTILSRAEKNQRNNELYHEFIKQIQLE